MAETAVPLDHLYIRHLGVCKSKFRTPMFYTEKTFICHLGNSNGLSFWSLVYCSYDIKITTSRIGLDYQVSITLPGSMMLTDIRNQISVELRICSALPTICIIDTYPARSANETLMVRDDPLRDCDDRCLFVTICLEVFQRRNFFRKLKDLLTGTTRTGLFHPGRERICRKREMIYGESLHEWDKVQRTVQREWTTLELEQYNSWRILCGATREVMINRFVDHMRTQGVPEHVLSRAITQFVLQLPQQQQQQQQQQYSSRPSSAPIRLMASRSVLIQMKKASSLDLYVNPSQAVQQAQAPQASTPGRSITAGTSGHSLPTSSAEFSKEMSDVMNQINKGTQPSTARTAAPVHVPPKQTGPMTPKTAPAKVLKQQMLEQHPRRTLIPSIQTEEEANECIVQLIQGETKLPPGEQFMTIFMRELEKQGKPMTAIGVYTEFRKSDEERLRKMTEEEEKAKQQYAIQFNKVIEEIRHWQTVTAGTGTPHDEMTDVMTQINKPGASSQQHQQLQHLTTSAAGNSHSDDVVVLGTQSSTAAPVPPKPTALE